MSLELIILPALCGYLYLRVSHKNRYEIARQSGYHVLFLSAITGLVIYALSRLLILASINTYIYDISSFWKQSVPVSLPLDIVVTFIVSYFAAMILNLFISRQKAEYMAAKTSGNFLEILLYECTKRRKFAEITLRTKKVYIGAPLETGIGALDGHDVTIRPLLSGHRKEDTLELVIDTKYSALYGEDYRSMLEARNLTMRDFAVVIPEKEIVSARIFDSKVQSIFRYTNPKTTEDRLRNTLLKTLDHKVSKENADASN
ncbi:MAG: hypothetical protein OXO51_04360 [Gemmatimonadota bacterium]|nr:hypothetical protein [Gemmatimonadota bacterium]